jgi:hypothetical protein
LRLNVFWVIIKVRESSSGNGRGTTKTPQDKTRTYNFGDCGAFAETSIDHREPRGRLTEPREEGLELLDSAYVVLEQQFQETPLVVVNGDPEGQSAEDLKVFVGKIHRDGLGERLCGLPSTRLSLEKQGFRKHVLVAVNNTKDKGALVLGTPVNTAAYGVMTSRTTDLEKIQRCEMTVVGSDLYVVPLPLSFYGFEEVRVRLFPGSEFEL